MLGPSFVGMCGLSKDFLFWCMVLVAYGFMLLVGMYHVTTVWTVSEGGLRRGILGWSVCLLLGCHCNVKLVDLSVAGATRSDGWQFLDIGGHPSSDNGDFIGSWIQGCAPRGALL